MKRSKRTKTSFEIAPSNITLEVLSNGSSHMSPSVFIRTPSRCYLFNCPEGTSRISNLLRLRPNQIQDIFITKDKWENIAGISGIILSKDYAEENIRLHGPPAVSEMIKSLKPMLDSDFANPAYPVRIENCDCKRDNFEDSTLFVHYLNIENSKEIRYLFNGSNSPKCTAFLVKLKPCLPPLDPLKLIELRIPRSPLISKLKFGETITLEDGRIIKPEDVIDYRKKSIEYPNLLVVDICSFENIHSISENYLLKDFMSDQRTQQMNYIIHFTQQKIFESEEYKNWIKDFGTKCTHLVLNIKGRFLPVSDATHNIQYLLNSIFPEGFPEICPFGQVLEGQIILQDDEKYDIKNKIDKNIGPIYFPEFLRRFSLRGNLLKDEINPILLDFNWKNFLKERIKLEPIELQKRIEDFKQIYLNTLNNTTRDVYPTIIFLGTSSAVSTKYRNVSSYLVRLSDSSNFLVDCGEATYGQLLALFGPSGIDQLLTKLNALFITHSHLDHFLGIFNLIYKRIEAFEKQELPYIPLVLVHDSTFFNLFKNYSQLFLNLNPYIISVGLPSLFCETSTTEKIKEHNSSINLIKYFPKNIFSSDEWNLSSAIAFQVDHTKWSCGYSFTTLKEQRKIVFSGDTRPCENIIKNGNNADILIHECTFEDGLEKDALIKKHSTMRQAFDSSLNMGAKNVIFTHFSARYHLVPPLPDYIINAGNVSVANDLMVVPFDLLPLFPKLLPIYQYLYKEELFDFELKKNTRIANEKLNKDNNSLNSYILKHKRKASF